MLRRGRSEAQRGGARAGSRKQRGHRRTPTLLAMLPVAVLLPAAGYVGAQQSARGGSESLQVRGDRAHRGTQQRSIAPRNAEPVEKTPGIGRACSEARGYAYYSLGASFEGLKLTTSGRQCEPPPPKVRAADGTLVYMSPSRQNTVAFIYGTCQPPPGTDGGCAPPLSISSYPACEQPRSLYKRYRGGGTPVPFQETRVRGIPAAMFDAGPRGGGFRLEMYAGDARVVIAGNDVGMVKRAADRMVAPSSSPGGATSARTELPTPIPGAAEYDAKQNPKC